MKGGLKAGKRPNADPELDEPRIMPTPERARHDALVYGEVVVFSELGTRGTSKALATRVTTQRVIDRLWLGEVLDDRQFAAACRFWTLYHQSGMAPIGAIDLNRAGGGSGGPAFVVSEFAGSARQQWVRALQHVPKARQTLFQAVVCDDMSLSRWVARLGQRPGRAVQRAGAELREALDAVVVHWRL
jgi:hypothetical protein